MTRFILAPALLACSLALVGCGEQPAEQPAAETSSPTETHGAAPPTPPTASTDGAVMGGDASAPAGGGAAPFAGGGSGQTPPLEGEWKARTEKVDELNEKLAASPNDAKLKAEAIEANYEVGNGLMHAPDLPPYKYRHALKYLRAARDLDPKHEKAAADIKQIEDIYQMMGRPIPQ